MSDEEKRETERRKREGSKRGEQYVANTEARRARRGSQAPPINDYDNLSIDEVEKEGEDSPGRRPRTSAITRSGTGTARPSSSRWTAASSRQRSGSRG